MRATQTMANPGSKQRLRDDIGNHVQDFLDKGGIIKVVSEREVPGTGNRPGWWPAAADATYLPGMDND